MCYVDPMRPVPRSRKWPYPSACHLMADSDAELGSMARTLGLKPAWRHGDHYDLTASKRARAIEFGAREVTSLDLVRLRQSKRDVNVPN